MEQHDNILAMEESEVGTERIQQLYVDPQNDEIEPLLQYARITDNEHEAAGVPPVDGAHPDSHTDFSGLKWYKRPSVYMLLPAFTLYAIAFGSTAVPTINLIQSLICRQYFTDKTMMMPDGSYAPIHIVLGTDNSHCNIPEVGALTAKFTLYQNLIAGILGALTAPQFGALSDRIGRKLVIAISTQGSLFKEILTILCFKYPDTFNYRWLLLGSFGEGIVGSFLLGFAVSTSYATDCTAPALRASAFGLFHGCLFLGIAVGPALGSIIINQTKDLLSVFYIALATHLLFIFWLLFILPESLTKERQLLARAKYATESKRTWLGHLNVFAPLKLFWPKASEGSARLRTNLVLISAIDFIMFGVSFGSSTVVLIYSKIRFQWSAVEQGYLVSTVNSTRVMGLVILLPLLIRFFRPKPATTGAGVLAPGKHHGCDTLDVYLVRLALVLETTGYALYGLANTPSSFVVGGVVASLGGIGSPTLQSSLTKHVPVTKTGQMLGAIALLHCIARVVGPTVFSYLYALTAKSFPQAVFVALGSLFCLAFLCAWFIVPGVSLDDRDEVIEHLEPET